MQIGGVMRVKLVTAGPDRTAAENTSTFAMNPIDSEYGIDAGKDCANSS